MKKRLLSIALCLAMLLTCLPAVAAAEQAPAPDRPDRGVTPWTDLSEDQIVVGGVVLNKGDYLYADTGEVRDTPPESGGYALWSGEDNILTLNNYNYIGDGYAYYATDGFTNTSAIYHIGSFNVRCIGDNTLINTASIKSDDCYSECITIETGKLTLTGTGTLNLTASYPIYATPEFSEEALNHGSGSININGITLNIRETTAEFDGMDMTCWIETAIIAANYIALNDCTVNICTGNSDAVCGIYSKYGDVTVMNSTVHIGATCNAIYGVGLTLQGSDINVSANAETNLDYAVIEGKSILIDDCNLISQSNFGPAIQATDGTLTVDSCHLVLPLDAEIVNEPAADSKPPVGYVFDCAENDIAPIAAFSRLYADVPGGQFYTDAVYWASLGGITQGVGGNRFGPEQSCTRSQIVTFLWRAHGCPEPEDTTHVFTDVAPNAFYYDAVLWAVENGITTGIGGNRFGPELPCTRSQAVTFLWRSCGKPGWANTENSFVDVPDDAYYRTAVLWAVETGITNGTGANRFGPNVTCSRSQIVTFLYRMATAPAPTQ